MYEWDPAKAAANVPKHSVAFEEAASGHLPAKNERLLQTLTTPGG
jgi:uncharacterized DUF497 family protein